MECGGVSLPWALEPGWGSTGEPPLDPVRLAATSMLHAALEVRPGVLCIRYWVQP